MRRCQTPFLGSYRVRGIGGGGASEEIDEGRGRREGGVRGIGGSETSEESGGEASEDIGGGAGGGGCGTQKMNGEGTGGCKVRGTGFDNGASIVKNVQGRTGTKPEAENNEWASSCLSGSEARVWSAIFKVGRH